MKQFKHFFLGMILIALIAGCGSSDPETINKIDTAVATWEANPIQNYDIEVQRYRGTDAMQIIVVSVRDGEITDAFHDCAPPPGQQAGCSIQRESAEGYTVEGLFERAREESYRISIVSFSEKTGIMTFMSLRNNLNIRVLFTPKE